MPIHPMRKPHLVAWTFGFMLHALAAIQAVRFYIRHPSGDLPTRKV
jgi:hypothetical protein